MAMYLLISSSCRLLVALVTLFAVRAIYRLTFHPLAKFPGPRLAATTSLYAGSYDLPFASSFCKELPRLHDEYGPIVRIRPNELHVRDMDSFRQVYRSGTQFKKDPGFYGAHVIDGSFFNIHETKKAKLVKDMYAPYFSRVSIQSLEASIQSKVKKLLKSINDAAMLCKPVDMTSGFKCLAVDVVMEYCYQKNFGALDAPDFRFKLIEDMEGLFATASFTWYFPRFFNFMCRVLGRLPQSFVQMAAPPLAASFEIHRVCQERILALQAEPLNPLMPSIFKNAISSEKNKGQPLRSIKELSADALVFFGAGTDTTAHALTTGTWHLLKNPIMLKTLQQELTTAIQDEDSELLLSFAALEKLPYLHAVVKESLRLSFGVPGRLPRVVPADGAVFCDQRIPAGTVISHSAYAYHMSEQYFPDAKSFKPERWLSAPSIENQNTIVSFSAGSRGCLGINLAYAELFTTLAYLFRTFDLKIFNTTDHDMDWHDCYTPATFGHLRVSVMRVGAVAKGRSA